MGRNVYFVVIFRIAVTLIIGGVFLPPDSQNPYAAVDAILLAIGGLIWAVSDIFLHQQEHQ